LLYNTEAVVIRSIKYGETHAIVTLLTPSGTVAAMARGAKKPQSKLASGTRLCAQGVYAIYQNTGMGTLQQVELQETRRGLHERLDLAAYAAYFCELVGAIAEPRPTGAQATYNLFVGALDRLMAAPETCSITARIWETKVLYAVGSSPDWTTCVRCGEALSEGYVYSATDGGLLCPACQPLRRGNTLLVVPPAFHRVLDSFLRVPWHRFGNITLSSSTQTALKTVLYMQLQGFAGIALKSRAVLESLDLDS